ncbi:MAG: hypothetical protein ACE5FC_03555 [Myxococcota bacterium]
MTRTIFRQMARGLYIPLLLLLAVPLMGASLHEAEDTIADARAAVSAAESSVTRYGRYEFYQAQAALTTAQAEYDAMDYQSAERFARKASALAQKSTTMQSFTD